MAVNLSLLAGAGAQFFTNSGVPLSGGLVYTYAAGTTTPQAAYTTSAGSTAHTNPIVLDSAGRVPSGGEIWLTDSVAYKFVLQTSLAVLIGTYDNVTGNAGGIYAAFAASSGSSLVGFIQAGSGAVATTVQAKLRQIVSVQDFGAVGNGSTDDTTAFTNAAATGNPIYVPSTSSFYALTALTATAKELLFGTGIVKVSGVTTAIPSVASISNNELGAIRVLKSTLAPTNNTTNGSVGLGSINTVVTRSGGFGQYGNWLSQYLVTAAVPSTEFDVGITSWATATNFSAAGAALFGMWSGANTPSYALGETFTGGGAIGMEINVGNRCSDFGLQNDIGGTRYTVGLQIVPDVLPALDGLNTTNVTITIASPGVVTFNAHGFTAGMGVVFGGTGTMPTGITAGTTYYVSAAGLAANTFQFSTTAGGASVNTTGSFVAPITALPSWPGSFGVVTGASVGGHRLWTGTLLRANTIMPAGYAQRDYGGDVASQAPLAHTYFEGYWTNGLDFSVASFANAVLKFGAGQVSGTATAGGGIVVPATVNGFLIVDIGGSLKRIPYFNP
jgi:hypothetical protein